MNYIIKNETGDRLAFSSPSKKRAYIVCDMANRKHGGNFKVYFE